MNDNGPDKKTVLVVGATGYIGNAVVAEAVRKGHQVIAVTRAPRDERDFHGAEVVVADVSDPTSIHRAFKRPVDVVISCLACRSGLASDFDAIDYQATRNVLAAALENGARQFILLSAICVRKPELPLQLAKLKMEDELIRSGIDYSIVRPTAYFWVFETQVPMIRKGRPGFLIGSGEQSTHNPISKEDLAEFMVGCIDSEERRNRLFIIGGPEVPENIVTYKQALLTVFEALGQAPRLVSIPAWLIRALIRVTGLLGHVSRRLGVFSEFLKISLYYMENDMRAPGYGSMTLRQHLLQTVAPSAEQGHGARSAG